MKQSYLKVGDKVTVYLDKNDAWYDKFKTYTGLVTITTPYGVEIDNKYFLQGEYSNTIFSVHLDD